VAAIVQKLDECWFKVGLKLTKGWGVVSGDHFGTPQVQANHRASGKSNRSFYIKHKSTSVVRSFFFVDGFWVELRQPKEKATEVYVPANDTELCDPSPFAPLRVRISPAGSRFAHARKTAQVYVLADDFDYLA
jgi:hypothetical protein